jgi:anti-anti-sigma regulatory factor
VLRITIIQSDETPLILKLEGKLFAPWIGELDEACRRASARSASATLDLAGLSFVDAQGTVALRDLRRRGMRLVGCSPLVNELLKETDR